jgi:hypothetical protein
LFIDRLRIEPNLAPSTSAARTVAAKPENGDCYIVLLPILQEFATRRAQTRESL